MPRNAKRLRRALSLSWLLSVVLMAGEAHADNCRVSLSQSRVDYGLVRLGSLPLGTRTVQLNILCADPSAMALRFSGPAADAQGFQLGHQGRFTLSLRHARVDGQAVQWGGAHLSGSAANARLAPGQTLLAQAAGLPVKGRHLTAQVEVDAELAPDALAVRREMLLEGLGTFEWISPPVPWSQ
ncbi:hypothetical protein ACW9H6_21675 [Pseudomonas sp. SDO528_S397]